MQREAAKKLIQDTFERPFDKEQFARFAGNLVNHLTPAPFPQPRTGQYIFADFRDYISSYDRIGKYEDRDGNKLDVLVVNLARQTSLDRARSAQRKFVAKYLKESQGGQLKDAALVAFVSPDELDWRFSFVRMDYKIETTPTGRVRVKDDFTPARRYSFLVGQNENSHTAQSRLIPILEDTEHDPTIADLEDSFSVESVTKEFFEQYRELFLRVKEALDNLVVKDKDIRTDFEEKGVDTVDFAKKLLGQIVFLYFLQKKGWFGVKRKAAWGTGSKGFLRELFQSKHGEYQNFFNDILEPLFYNTLAVERPENYSDRFDCRIPFLNGGLFDPLNNYDWVNTDILLPNDLFSNGERTKQGDRGTGVLDVFDRYNFTVKEDEPLEKEVAVDPEMLGKVFENLLEVKDRKSKGTYYTPREIVHYMCQESLTNYLATQLGENFELEDLETLVRHGETAQENDALVNERGEERGRYKYKLPESIRECAERIDQKLADIKVCDPAVGSGAFLVGMMSEIIRTRTVLTEFLQNSVDRTQYELKRHAIQNSLYGVDIDPGAVEIAKLRLWLSLIVDEEDYKQIKPLPNLDYKIMQGNSLLEEYEGIRLVDERFFEKQEQQTTIRARFEKEQSRLQREYIQLNAAGHLSKSRKGELEKRLREVDKALKELDKPRPIEQDDLGLYGKSAVHSKAEHLLKLHEDFFGAFNKRQKEQLKRQIDELTWDLIEETLKQHGKSEKLELVRKFQQTNTRPFFLWRLNFGEVFSASGGFDVVIANPPYVSYGLRGGQPLSKEEKDCLKRCFPNSAEYKISLYAVFMDKAIQIAKPDGGIQTLIVPDSFLLGRYFSQIRKYILQISEVVKILLFPFSVFQATVGYSVVYVLRRCSIPNADHGLQAIRVSNTDQLGTRSYVSHYYPQRYFEAQQYNRFRLYFDQQTMELVRRMEEDAKPLGAFIKFSSGLIGLAGQTSIVSDQKRSSKWLPGIVSGGAIKAYTINTDGHFLLYDKSKIKSGFDCVDYKSPKLFMRQTGDSLVCAYDDKGLLALNNVHIGNAIGSSHNTKYLLGLLNSKALNTYYRAISLEEGRPMAQIDIETLEGLPVKEPTSDQRSVVEELVDRILVLTSQDDYVSNARKIKEVEVLRSQLDDLFWKIYMGPKSEHDGRSSHNSEK